MIDAATLTGHSSFTGKTHAAAMASDGALEHLAVAAGLFSGEHVVPMVRIIFLLTSRLLRDLHTSHIALVGATSLAAARCFCRKPRVLRLARLWRT